MTTFAKIEELQPKDICDRCGARATVEYELEHGGRLLFCSHHSSKLPTEVTDHWKIVGMGNFK